MHTVVTIDNSFFVIFCMSSSPRRGRQTHQSYSDSSESVFALWFQDPRVKLFSIFLLIVVVIFGLFQLFARDESTDKVAAYQASLISSGTAYAQSTGEPRVLKSRDMLYATDTGAKTQQAQLELSATGQLIVLDKNTEITLDATSNIEVVAGSLFADLSSQQKVITKFANISGVNGSTEIIALQNPVASTFTVISGRANVTTQNAVVEISPGKMITIFAQDTSKTDLSDKVLPISDTITSHPLFVLKNGAKKIAEVPTESWSGVVVTASGVLLEDGVSLTGASISGALVPTFAQKYIEITSPKDGSQTNKSLVSVTGRVLRDEVVKVLINEKPALVKADKTFSLSDIALTQRNNTILYKALGANGAILDSGYLIVTNPQMTTSTVAMPKEIATADKKLYYISSPSTNPYQTTDRTIRITWVVPKGKVKAVEVNGFRLKKYIPYSTSWVYTATADGQYPNLKSDLNLYKVVYYGQNDEILWSTLYSIFLESPQASGSGETN